MNREKWCETEQTKRVLVWENGLSFFDQIEAHCALEKMKTVFAEDKEDFLGQLEDGKMPTLVLFGMRGLKEGFKEDCIFLQELRRRVEHPILAISGQGEETEKLSVFAAGADDYVSTECSSLELLARIKAHFRRYLQLASDDPVEERQESVYRVDGLEVHDSERRVVVDGREVRLTPSEYEILRLLVKERGTVLSIDRIYESVWNMKAIGADNTIAVHIRHIREKIEENPKNPHYLKVVWGTGYKVG